MNDRVNDVYEQARRLTAEEQLALLDLLRASAIPEQDVQEAWRKEMEDRIAALDRGEARLVPAAELFARLRET